MQGMTTTPTPATPAATSGGATSASSPDTGPAPTPVSTLQEVFGYPAFRGEQAEIIDTVLGGDDALVLMPTGGGKSLCYQIPALLRPGTGVVISPLIALMQDQVDALSALGLRGGVPQLHAGSRGAARGRARLPRRRARPALPRAGAAGRGADRAAARPGPQRALRDRRGALRLVVGSRLPARLPQPDGARTTLARRAPDRAHRHGHRRHRRRDQHPPGAHLRPPLRGELRPAQHRVPHRREGQAAPAAALAPAQRARRRRGHRLLPLAQVGRADRHVPHRQRHHRRCPITRVWTPDARRPPGAVPARAGSGDGRDDRVRDGHRQARRAVRGPPGPAEVGGGLLPGDRPRRPRRRCPPPPGSPTAWPTSSSSAR